MKSALRIVPYDADEALEERIQAALDAATLAHRKGDRIAAYAHLDAFRRLVAQRSPRQKELVKNRSL